MYKNIIFDLYGTLIDIRTDEEDTQLWKNLALLYGYKGAVYTPKEIKASYQKYVLLEKEKVQKTYPEYKYIDIPIENVFQKLFNEKKIDVEKYDIESIAASFRCFSTKKICLYDGVIDLLDSLKAAGKKIYLLSNAQSFFTLNELVYLSIYKYFDDIFISSEHNISKPDTLFFEKLIDKHKLNKTETIMIGNDYLSDIEGAYNAGIDSIYIHQDISSPIKGELKSNFKIMDGDVRKIKEYLHLHKN